MCRSVFVDMTPGCAALEEPPADSTRRPPRLLMDTEELQRMLPSLPLPRPIQLQACPRSIAAERPQLYGLFRRRDEDRANARSDERRLVVHVGQPRLPGEVRTMRDVDEPVLFASPKPATQPDNALVGCSLPHAISRGHAGCLLHRQEHRRPPSGGRLCSAAPSWSRLCSAGNIHACRRWALRQSSGCPGPRGHGWRGEHTHIHARRTPVPPLPADLSRTGCSTLHAPDCAASGNPHDCGAEHLRGTVQTDAPQGPHLPPQVPWWRLVATCPLEEAP